MPPFFLGDGKEVKDERTAGKQADRGALRRCRALARQYRLLETGGSDFHGSHRPGVPVGAATISREMFERVLTAAGS